VQELKSKLWIIIIVLLFLFSNLLLINRLGIYYLGYIPLVLLFVVVIFTRIDIIFYSIALMVPLSMPLHVLMPGQDYDISLPSELMIVSLLFVFLAKCFLERKYDSKILKHPVSIAIYFYLLWMFITCFTSTSMIISFKFFLSRFWFIAVFYFFGATVFGKIKNIKRYEWLYISSLLIVIAYTFGRHIPAGLNNQQASNWACQPLYNDHTAYGAALAMVLPFAIGSLLLNKKSDVLMKILKGSIIIVIILAIIFSYTRATWLSLMIASGIWVLMMFRIKFWKIAVVAATLFILFFSFKTDIMFMLERNRSGSSADFSKHFQSMTNVSTDDSNLERINRWNCAISMFKEKPVFGWGPGTYQFEYGAFQLVNDMTIISTFQGDLGTAHSEYLGPLSEQGVLGLVAFVMVLITSMYTGIMVYLRAKKRKVSMLAMIFVVALSTYYVHGFLNNFLDSDKLSALFWANISMLVALDIYKKKRKNTNVEIESEEYIVQ
jgi:putative inorganic carbon (hco3(-)) transporter